MEPNGFDVKSFVPTVLWAQCENAISLKVLVSDVKVSNKTS